MSVGLIFLWEHPGRFAVWPGRASQCCCLHFHYLCQWLRGLAAGTAVIEAQVRMSSGTSPSVASQVLPTTPGRQISPRHTPRSPPSFSSPFSPSLFPFSIDSLLPTFPVGAVGDCPTWCSTDSSSAGVPGQLFGISAWVPHGFH